MMNLVQLLYTENAFRLGEHIDGGPGSSSVGIVSDVSSAWLTSEALFC